MRAALIRGWEVHLASDGRALALLRAEFPDLPSFELPGYEVTYRSSSMLVNFSYQVPRIWRAIQAEQRLIADLQQQENYTAILSDNRYGCYHSEVPSIFISHQLQLQLPNAVATIAGNAVQRQLLRPFREIWIPDVPGADNLAGILTQNNTGKPAYPLGVLSRMKALEAPAQRDWLVVLSGPEPQRTRLEERLFQQLENSTFTALIVGGKTEEATERRINSRLQYVSYLTAEQLNTAAASSRWLLSRSGYSTLLDLAWLQKPALLIPTPGQTEQLYLAKRWHERRIFNFQTQSKLDLATAVTQFDQYPGFRDFAPQTHLLERALDRLV